jgi:hypothetical protein
VTPFSAGTIEITGAAMPITLTPTAGNAYNAVSGAVQLFQGGETITFDAAGADVPAFLVTVPAPPPLSVVQPPAAPVTTLSGSVEFVPTWTPVADGEVTILMMVEPSPTLLAVVSCNFPASAGSGTVPAGIMSALGPSAGGTLDITLQHEVLVPAGEWTVHAVVQQIAVRSDGEARWIIDVD